MLAASLGLSGAVDTHSPPLGESEDGSITDTTSLTCSRWTQGILGEKASRTSSFLSCCPVAVPMEKGGNVRAQCHPLHPLLMLRSPPSARPGVIPAHCGGQAGFGALLFAPSFHGTYNVQQSMGGPAAKPDVMLSLCHLWARSASISQKGRRGGRAVLPQPFWCMEPCQNSNGKSIQRRRSV